jgi:hypothetical protein
MTPILRLWVYSNKDALRHFIECGSSIILSARVALRPAIAASPFAISNFLDAGSQQKSTHGIEQQDRTRRRAVRDVAIWVCVQPRQIGPRHQDPKKTASLLLPRASKMRCADTGCPESPAGLAYLPLA